MKPKTLQQIKDEYAKERCFDNWVRLQGYYDIIPDHVVDGVCKLYAQEMVKQHLEKAAENVKAITVIKDWKNGPKFQVSEIDKESILNTKIELL